MIRHVVPDGVRAVSLARYLARAWPLTPAWVWRDALKKKDARVNGAKAGAGVSVAGGDELALYVPDKYLTGDARVLFCDGRLLAVEKPQGLPVDVDADGVGADTLLSRVRRAYPGAALCHRLDAGTGGAVLLALDGGAHRAALDAFKSHAVEKEYRAVVVGRPAPDAATLTDYLIKDARASRVRVARGPEPGARRAVLSYRVLESGCAGAPDLSLTDIELGTGRTHQIRVQMANAGWPVLGDDKYGDREVNRLYRAGEAYLWCARMTLHIEGWDGVTVQSDCAFRPPRRVDGDEGD